MPHYAQNGMKLLNWVVASPWTMVHWMGLSIIVLVTGACHILEVIVGASLVPFVINLSRKQGQQKQGRL
jgi:hypothetical protein